MSRTSKKSKDEFVLEVTPAEYNAALKKGWNDDDIQKPGKSRYRRAKRLARPEDLKPSNIKVQISLRVDLDVLEHFKKRSEVPNAAPYQTQINAELRRAMERDLATNKNEFEVKIEDLTRNKKFIRAVAEQLKELDAA